MKLFKDNKYGRWYYSIIEHAKCQGRNKSNGYFESHHIIPKCMGGTEEVLLTAREHYICHLLLTKMVVSKEHLMKMSYALMLMNGHANKHQRYQAKSRLYEYSKRLHSIAVSETHSGKTISAETREKLGAVQRGKPKSESHKQSLKANHKGMTGRKQSPETKEKIRLAMLKRKEQNMAYSLSTRSLKRLEGVHPDLVKLVKRAIEITEVDFVVQEGLRTLATQKEYMKRGVTRTLASKHLKQADGYGHAVDLVPLVKGQPRWEWPVIYPIAVAMRQASDELNIPIRWGGVWDRKIEELGADMKAEVAAYCARHPGPDFIDGPHYELRR